MIEWLEALRTTLHEYEHQEFEWGTVDCCQFAGSYVEKLTGRNPARDLGYTSSFEASRYLLEHEGFEGAISQFLPRREGEPQPGDVVLARLSEAEDPLLECVGINTGYCVFSLLEGEGLFRISSDRILAAWRAE